jgi:hypothetical protein
MRGIRASEAKTHPHRDFLGSKMFVGRQGEPSLICDSYDRPCDFTRIFGLRSPPPKPAQSVLPVLSFAPPPVVPTTARAGLFLRR